MLLVLEVRVPALAKAAGKTHTIVGVTLKT
jgi:hypothetical protein